MKTKKHSKNKNIYSFKDVILQHINDNIKDYLILSIIFIIGVMIGVLIINNSNEESKQEIKGYINGFINTVKDENYEVDKSKLTKISIVENLKLVGIIWIAGTTVIGIPIIYIIILYKGFCLGYTISAIISRLGMWKRNTICNIIVILSKHNCNTSYINAKC